eukprot:365166-Chlamydomonas_euryale.AAC.7
MQILPLRVSKLPASSHVLAAYVWPTAAPPPPTPCPMPAALDTRAPPPRATTTMYTSAAAAAVPEDYILESNRRIR